MKGIANKILFILFLAVYPTFHIRAQLLYEDLGSTVWLKNDQLSLVIEKSSAKITYLGFQGENMLYPDQSGYFTILASDYGTDYETLRLTNCAFSVVKNDESTIDLAFTPSAPDYPLGIILHYVLRKNESGFYFYLEASKEALTADVSIAQLRYAMRLDSSMLDIRISDERKGRVSSPTELQNAQGEVMDATFLLESGEIVTKYVWSSPTEEARVYGLNDGQRGVWMMRGGSEYLNGGPTKQHNTCHGTSSGPIILSLLYSEHYGSSGSYVSGEWRKIFGPVFVYLNARNSEAELWEDAKAEYQRQYRQWPYSWLENSDYQVKRAEVSGRFPGLDTGWVVLARPREYRGLDWQQQGADSYIFRSRIGEGGLFVIPAVRSGAYSLYAFSQGRRGEFRMDGLEVDSTNIYLGTLDWPHESEDQVLWQIGTPDRSAAEFRHGDDFRHWGLWFSYPEEFPQDIDFTVGESQERNDWNYAQMIMWKGDEVWAPRLDASTGEGYWEEPSWRIHFSTEKIYNDTATLTIAFAGVSRDAVLHVKLNGEHLKTFGNLVGDGSVHRNGIFGFFRERSFRFEASRLLEGDNTLELELEMDRLPSTRTNYSMGIMYDYLCLEVQDPTDHRERESIEGSLKVYPNPARDYLYIDPGKEMENCIVKVFDMTGRMVYMEAHRTFPLCINLQDYASGLYTVLLESERGLSYSKIKVE